jgi:hypothetical protein
MREGALASAVLYLAVTNARRVCWHVRQWLTMGRATTCVRFWCSVADLDPAAIAVFGMAPRRRRDPLLRPTFVPSVRDARPNHSSFR